MAALRDLINSETEAEEADKLTIFAPREAAYSEVSGVVKTLDSQTFTDVRSSSTLLFWTCNVSCA